MSTSTTQVTRTVFRRAPGHKLVRSNEPISFPTRGTDVLIRVHAVSLNYRDFNILRGRNAWATRYDGIPCSDAAGEVVAVGTSVTRFQIGDRVSPLQDQKNLTGTEDGREWLGGEVDGVLATHLMYPEEVLVKIPPHMSWEEAAMIPCAGLTAWSALNLPCFLASKTVLLQGTGGVSLFALKLALAGSAKVIITSSSDEKLRKLKDKYPTIETVNCAATPAWDEKVLEITNGLGVDIVVENGGAATLERTMKCTKRRGFVGLVGYLGGREGWNLPNLIDAAIERSITLQGINVGSKLDQEQMNVFLGLQKVDLSDIIDRRFGFNEASAAFEYLASGAFVGKIIIQVP